MSIVGEATGVLGLLGKGWSRLRDRLDPARAQAKRLIETIEAYGVARQPAAGVDRLCQDAALFVAGAHA